MIRSLLVGLCASLSLMLAACADMEQAWQGWGSSAPEAPPPLIGFVFDNGEPVDGVHEVVFRLNMERPELVYPFLTMAMDENFYLGMPVHRAVPGLVAEIGDGYWNGRENRRLPVNNPESGDLLWGANLLAVKVNADGTVGPELVFTQSNTVLERHVMPKGIVIGKLVDGARGLKGLRKGDKLVRMWAKDIPHPSSLAKEAD